MLPADKWHIEVWQSAGTWLARALSGPVSLTLRGDTAEDAERKVRAKVAEVRRCWEERYGKPL